MSGEVDRRPLRRAHGLRFASRVAIAAVWVMLALPVQGATGDAEIDTFMRNYLETFDHGHAWEIVPLYDAPLFMLAPNGDLRAYETPKDIRLTIKKWKRYMFHGGFEDSRWVALNVKRLTEGTAIASTAFERLNSRGQVYQRGGATYTLRKKDGNWVITLIHIHDPDAVMSID
ncbi:MAG: hypothetical protein OXF33_09345 [Rhodospirillales bacterium]|nr:hypothetical protein [Rhodospirillales bacterium]